MRTIVVTGSAGFIGYFVSIKLLERGENIIGIDNHNDYYDRNIKEARLKKLEKFDNYKHFKVDISNQKKLEEIFKSFKVQDVVNLAAQAGVRYSIENPSAYIKSNIVGFANILENCRQYKIEHLVYASTSSVYGANTKMPFSEHDNVNHPLIALCSFKKI
jgi:UDP-glucuronate 4-epimerase